MKKGMLIGAALAALMMAGQAHAEGGYVGALYSEVDAEGIGSSSGYALEGAAAFGESVSLEVDGVYSDSDGGEGTLGLTGHAYMRSDEYLFGGYVGLSEDEHTLWNAGLEAARYFSNWTLAGSVGYAKNDDIDLSGYGVNAEVRVFPTENIRLQGGMGVATIDVAYFDDLNVVSFGGGGEMRIGESPASILVSFAHAEIDDLSSTSIDTVSVGVRFNWGGSLLARDRGGASQGHGGIASAFIF